LDLKAAAAYFHPAWPQAAQLTIYSDDAPAMTILRLAHLDAEGLVLDGAVRSLRDQFVTHNWSELLYRGLYFSAEREYIENSLVFAQRRVVCNR
jgi:argininosuccinate synthase